MTECDWIGTIKIAADGKSVAYDTRGKRWAHFRISKLPRRHFQSLSRPAALLRRVSSPCVTRLRRTGSSQQELVSSMQADDIPEDDRLADFRRRCVARVAAVKSGRMSLVDTVDTLQATAKREGLIEIFGQDEIQRVLGEVFAGKATNGRSDEENS